MSPRLNKTTFRGSAFLAAVLALSGCAGPVAGPATMMAGPSAAHGAALSVATYESRPTQVRVIPVTAETLAEHGGLGLAGGSDVYRVGLGDVVQIHAVNAPELTLSSGYRVENDGMIQVPFLGRVAVDDRSTLQISADLTERLRRYITDPQVDVRVIEFNARRITVTGEVARPGRLPITDRPLTLIDAIHDAGGFDGDPERMRVTLIRGGIERAVDLRGFLTRGTATPVLQDGDVVRVGGPRPLFAGDPQPVQSAFVHDGNRVREIGLSGGPVTLAQLVPGLAPMPGAAVFVLRDAGTMVRALRIEVDAALDPAFGGRFVLRPGDMVSLDPNPTQDVAGQVARLTPALRAMHRD